MSPLAERRRQLLGEDLAGRDLESAAEMTGCSSEAATARRPGTTRINLDMQEKRCPRHVMCLSIVVVGVRNREQVRRGQPSTSSRASMKTSASYGPNAKKERSLCDGSAT